MIFFFLSEILHLCVHLPLSLCFWVCKCTNTCICLCSSLSSSWSLFFITCPFITLVPREEDKLERNHTGFTVLHWRRCLGASSRTISVEAWTPWGVQTLLGQASEPQSSPGEPRARCRVVFTLTHSMQWVSRVTKGSTSAFQCCPMSFLSQGQRWEINKWSFGLQSRKQK